MARPSNGGGRRHRWSALEKELRGTVGPLIAGVDEVGRGPLAGPVVACAVVMPPDARAIAGVDDSKKLVAAERTRLARRIRERALSLGVGAASVREIDRLNIYHATVLAMRRALSRLAVAPDHVIVDGKSIRTLQWAHTAVVGGDARCYSIACASIVAKVTRDRVMHALAARYPDYRWERNVGYGTAAHLEGLLRAGASPHHRRSFVPVHQLSLDLDVHALAAQLADEIDERGERDDTELAELEAVAADTLGDAATSAPAAPAEQLLADAAVGAEVLVIDPSAVPPASVADLAPPEATLTVQLHSDHAETER